MALQLPATFDLERYFDKYEFNTRYLLSCSDAEALGMQDLMAMADDDAKKAWNELKFSYTEMLGSAELRDLIAGLHGVTRDDVTVCVPQEGIYMAMNCLMHYLKGKNNNAPFHAVAVYPAYQSLYENLKTHSCDISYWTARLTPQGWDFDLDELRALLRPDTRLLVVNFPHNPTGYVPQAAKWKELVDLCKEKNIFLFSDEMYSLTNNDGSDPNPSACSIYDNSISLFGMSKTFAMPGLRLGWLCTKNKQIFNMMASFKDYLTICPPSPSEQLSIIGLRNYKLCLKHTMDIVHKNLDLCDAFFAQYPDLFEWHRPRACTVAFVKIKGWLLKLGEGGASGMCDVLVKEKELLLLPAKMYSFDDEYVRLGFGRRNMEECLKVFDEFLQERKK